VTGAHADGLAIHAISAGPSYPKDCQLRAFHRQSGFAVFARGGTNDPELGFAVRGGGPAGREIERVEERRPRQRSLLAVLHPSGRGGRVGDRNGRSWFDVPGAADGAPTQPTACQIAPQAAIAVSVPALQTALGTIGPITL
jgi:hypothetical protein